MLRVVFFGTPDFAVPYLDALLDAPDIKVVAVVTQPDKPAGRKQELHPSPVKERAILAGIPVLQPETLKNYDVHDQLRAFSADLFVVFAYGKIIPPIPLKIPPLGCVNVHPSLLPRHRGPSPITTAVLQGDTETGVTIMLLDEEMDTGPILDQIRVSINRDETTPTLTARLSEIGAPFLVKTIRGYADGSLTPKPQNDAEATYTTMLSREAGKIDWSNSPEAIQRKINAYTPWPGTYTEWNRNGVPVRLKVFQASIPPDQDPIGPDGEVFVRSNRLFIGCKNGAPLEILTLQLEGKSALTAAQFLAGFSDIHRVTLE